MAQYVIYFNQQWVGDHPEEWFHERGPLAEAVVDDMKAAGVYVFAGGLEEDIRPGLHRGRHQRDAGVHRRTLRRVHRLPGRAHRGGCRGRRGRPDVGGKDRGSLRLAAGGPHNHVALGGGPRRSRHGAKRGRSRVGRPGAARPQGSR